MTDPKCIAERPCDACFDCLWRESTHGPTASNYFMRRVFDAALRRAREEGAAEMRERAALVPRFVYGPDVARLHPSELKRGIENAIRSLPLTPDEEEPTR